VVEDLETDDPQVVPWRIRDDVGKISVQAEQKALEFLGLGDDDVVGRVDMGAIT